MYKTDQTFDEKTIPIFPCKLFFLEKYPQCASIAQLVEHGTENPCVVGSIPTGGTTNFNPFIFRNI